jgi:hypothetical protein
MAIDAAAEAFARVRQSFTTELEAENVRLRSLIDRMLGILPDVSTVSGVCCCGDGMETHAHPMSAGHSPTDSGSYAVSGWEDDARAALANTRGDA